MTLAEMTMARAMRLQPWRSCWWLHPSLRTPRRSWKCLPQQPEIKALLLNRVKIGAQRSPFVGSNAEEVAASQIHPCADQRMRARVENQASSRNQGREARPSSQEHAVSPQEKNHLLKREGASYQLVSGMPGCL